MDLSLFGQRPVGCITATLHYIGLASAAPQALADYYGAALGYEFEEDHGLWLGSAPGRKLMIGEGASRTLVSAGYAVADAAELARLRRRLEASSWPARHGPSPFFSDAVHFEDPDGTRFAFGLADEELPPVTASMALPARLQHVVMASTDPDRVVRFFTDVIGFTLSDNVLDTEGGVRTSFLRCSAEHHSFAVFKAPENRLDHHCYETPDWNSIRDWGDHFAGQRFPLKWGPGRHGPGNNLFVFVHDIDGNWVELSAELEVVSHDRPVGEWPHEEHTLNSWGQGFLRS